MKTLSAVLTLSLVSLALTGCPKSSEPNRPLPEEPVSDDRAPADAASFGGHKYKVYDQDVSWHEAKKHCEKLGGHLATVASKEEHEFIMDLADGQYVYLGATDEKEEGKWVWVDGTKWEFTAWLGGQPNNSFGSEHYLSTYEGGWNDAAVAGDEDWMPTGYVCEWD
jgi:hypothetical protein